MKRKEYDMKPTEPTRPDGAGGVLDAEGRHWCDLVNHPGHYSNPPSQVSRFVETGDIIETSMPWYSTFQTGAFYTVFHHHVRLTFPSYTIQAFANGMQEEWIDACKANSGHSTARESYIFPPRITIGAAFCRNLSSPFDEAAANRAYVTGSDPRFSSQPLPLRTAALVRKHTSRIAKGGTGFFRMPFVPKAANHSGGLGSIYIEVMNAFLADIANYVDASIQGGATATLVLYHQTESKKTGTVQTTPVNSVSTHPILSSVRGRVSVRS